MSHALAVAQQVPHVDDRDVDVEVGVLLVRRRDHEQVGLGEHVGERPEVDVVRARTDRCRARARRGTAAAA